MSTAAPSNRLEPTMPSAAALDAEACWILACLMSDTAVDIPGNGHLQEPWKGIIARVGTIPLGKRLETIGRELEAVQGLDVEAVLDRVFATDPRRPESQPAAPIRFPFPTPIIDQKPETESCGFETRSLAAVLAMPHVGIDWCVEELIPVEAVAILGGPPGQGKSWMLLDLALALIAGQPWLGRFPTKRGRVLYVDEESPLGLLRHRLGKLVNARGRGIPADDLRFALGQGLCLARKDSVEKLRSTIAAIQPTLVIVDSLIRVHGSEENSASEMARVFAEIKRLVRDFGCSVVFADHQKKPGLGTVSQDLLLRGTTEKVAFVDTLLSLTRKDGMLVVEHSKSRFAPPVPSFVIAIEDEEPGWTTVRIVGDAEAIRQQSRDELARELVSRLLADGSWKSRKELAEAAREARVPVKNVDEVLRSLYGQGQVGRENRKPAGGRGNKTAFYRLKPVANSVSDFQSIIGDGNGIGIETGGHDPDGTLRSTSEEAAP